MSENFAPVEAHVSQPHFGFRFNSRKMLNVFRDAETSLPFSPEPPLTPVLNLTQSFGNLSTLAGDTPRRCLDLSNLSNGEEETAFNFSQSPRILKSDQKTEPQDGLGSRKNTAQLFQSKVLCSTPGTPSCIQHIRRKIISPAMNKENEAGGLEEYEMKDLGSPITAVATQRMPEASYGFPELCPVELEETEKPTTGHLSSMAILLSGPLLTQDINVSEVSMNKNRLFRSPSLPEKLNRPALKRVVKGQSDETPIKAKWKCSPIQGEPDGVALLKKTVSLSDLEIVRALDQDCDIRQLTGDFSSVCALPTVTGRHQDLKYITAETVAALLQDGFQSLIEQFFIIDCRYPYEYHGGHIKGALNIHRQDDLLAVFLNKPLLPSCLQKRLILMFHCEFSSERGPKMCRYLRKEDRAMNEYPALHYPELYVLQGGYKEFFLKYKELCEPQSYCPMHHQDFKAELLRFRVKSKRCAGERRRRDQIAHLMKL